MILTCYIVDDIPVSLELIKAYIEQTPGLELAGTETDSVRAMEQLIRGEVQADLTFLDIEMPVLNGMQVAEIVGKHTRVVFTTGHSKYGPDAFALNALDYLMKPVSYERFLQTIGKARELLGNGKTDKEPSRFLFIPGTGKGSRIKLLFDDIIYIKADSNYINYVLRDRTIMSYCSMENAVKALPAHQFCRVHRSYAVNIAMIDKIEAQAAIMIDGTEIPLGRKYKKEFWKIVT